MNGQSAQQENPAIPAKSPSNPFNRKILIYVIVLLLVFFLGFISSSILPYGRQVVKPSPSPQKPTIDESKLPVSLLLLTNPLIYEWRGSVKGKMTKKDDQNFTLADEQGNSITITNRMPSGDVFKSIPVVQVIAGRAPVFPVILMSLLLFLPIRPMLTLLSTSVLFQVMRQPFWVTAGQEG